MDERRVVPCIGAIKYKGTAFIGDRRQDGVHYLKHS